MSPTARSCSPAEGASAVARARTESHGACAPSSLLARLMAVSPSVVSASVTLRVLSPIASGVTLTNAPAVGSLIGASGPVVAGAYNEIDVSAYVSAEGTVSVALTPLSSTNLRLNSRETASPPELVVSTAVSGGGPPAANDVAAVTDEDVVLNWVPDVSDPDLDPLTCSIVGQATSGTATVAPDCSAGTYTPDGDFNGSDSFSYRADDGALSDDGVVSVTVNSVNDVPVAEAQSVTAPGTALAVTLSATDADGACPLSFAVASDPSHGSLGAVTNETCSFGSGSAQVQYTPDPGYSGADAFTFTVTDPASAVSAPATVTITVAAPQSSFTFTPAADSYVNGALPSSNFGTQTQLRTDSSPDIRSYLRFDVSGLSGPVTSATLRVSAASNLGAGYEVRSVADNGWGESSLTYANAPAVGSLIGASGPVVAGAYNEIDVSAYVSAEGTVSVALTPLSSTNLRLNSRETASPPELVIDTG